MFLGASKFCCTDTKLFFAIILFDLVWIAEVKFAALAFACNDVGHTAGSARFYRDLPRFLLGYFWTVLYANIVQ